MRVRLGRPALFPFLFVLLLVIAPAAHAILRTPFPIKPAPPFRGTIIIIDEDVKR